MNNHHAIFAAYAASGIWTAMHVVQFACMAMMLAGSVALFFVLDDEAGVPSGPLDSVPCRR